MKRKTIILLLLLCMSLLLIACGEKEKKAEEEKPADLSGKSLMVYCGAGMTEPFQEIADSFQEETRCKVTITFANAGQIQSQINTTKEGDFFIAGSSEELEPVKEEVTDSKELVKHIPVLLVAKGNPKEITGLKDLTKSDVVVVAGDPEATPIGKIFNKALMDLELKDQVNITATMTTAPQLVTAIVSGQADATVVWKENASDKDTEIIDTADLDKYVKTVPVATLKSLQDDEAGKAFLKYLDGKKAKEIWEKYGYETLN